jgi:hypothetical protein
MKFFGHANLQQNELREAVIPIETSFPSNPKVGRLAFVDSVLYICVSKADGLPVWVPLTKELTMDTYTQATASDTWVIDHRLNTTGVQVQVFDEAGRVMIPDDITINSSSRATVEFNTPAVGRAVVLTGHQDGNVKPTYSYTHYQDVASATWNIPHNLGYNPIVRVFVGNAEVQPESIVHNTANDLTITFMSPYVGVAKLV